MTQRQALFPDILFSITGSIAMYIGEQLVNPPTERLRLSAQLGVERVVIDNRGDREAWGKKNC